MVRNHTIVLSIFFLGMAWLIPQGVRAEASAQPAARALQVGILPINTPRALIRSYQPLQEYLQKALGRPLQLVTAPDFKTFHARTLAGDYDLIVTAAHLGRLAQTQAHFIPLARYTAMHRTLLITARDQPLKSVQDLRGKVVAGIDPLTLAMSESMLWLRGHGLHAGADYTLLETPAPVSAAYAVKNHQAVLAVGSIQGMKLMPEALRQDLDIFANLPEMPSLLWLAHPRMAADVARIKSALLAFTPASGDGAQFYAATGYQGMREVSNEESAAMEPAAQEAKKLLEKK